MKKKSNNTETPAASNSNINNPRKVEINYVLLLGNCNEEMGDR